MKALASLFSATTLVLLVVLLLGSPKPVAAQADCDLTCGEEEDGGAGCVNGTSKFVNSICGTCYLVSCTPLPCSQVPASEGTWVTKKCVGGVWEEAWTDKPCGTC